MEELYFGYPRRRRTSPKRRRTSPKRRKASPKRRKASPKRKLTKKMLDSLSLEKLKKLAKKYKVSCYKKGTKVCVKKSTLLKRLKSSRSINKILLSASKMRKEKKHRRSPKRSRRSRFGGVTFLDAQDFGDAITEANNKIKYCDINVGDKLYFNPPNQEGAKVCTVSFNEDETELICNWKSVMDYDSDSGSRSPSPSRSRSRSRSRSPSRSPSRSRSRERELSRFGMKTIPPNYPNLSTPTTHSSGTTYKGMLDRYNKISSTQLSYNMVSNGGYSAPGKSMHAPRDFRYNPRLLGTSSMPSYTNISKPKSKFGQYFR